MNLQFSDLLSFCKRKYKQNLLKTFYIVFNGFTLSLDNDPQTIRNIMKNH